MSSKKCEHNKRKERCKECGGSSLCIHNRYKYRCIDCKGSSICEHNKQKKFCIDCKGSGICQHNKRHINCKECKGINICEHEKQKWICKMCNGKGICIHNREKYSCKDCKGSSICEHNKRKSKCKLCGGKSLCMHNREKLYCKDCGGNGICFHKKDKRYCKECGGSALCKSAWCSTIANKKYDKYCFHCFIYLFPDKEISRNYKTKEKSVVEYIKKEFQDFTWISDKKVIDGCSRRRPDLLLDLGYQVIIVEVDENQHINYDTTCENKRLMEISQDNGFRPIIFIRFNPDDYIDKDKNKVTSCWNNRKLCSLKKSKLNEWNYRLKELKREVESWINNTTDKTIEVKHLFYN